jgi:hypothetical protein
MGTFREQHWRVVVLLAKNSQLRKNLIKGKAIGFTNNKYLKSLDL